MEAKLTREQANEVLHKYVKGENYITHSYAVEAIMRGLAKKLAPDDVEYPLVSKPSFAMLGYESACTYLKSLQG